MHMCLQASYMFPTNIYTSSFDPNLFITNSNKQVQAPERLQAKKKTRTAAESPRPKQVIDAIPIDEVHDIIGPRMSRELQMTAGLLNGYAGAPCPTCGDDLGSQVPKSTDFSLALKTISDQSEDVKNGIKNAMAACRVHCDSSHPGIPLWNAYRRQEQDSDRARKPTTIAALGGNGYAGAPCPICGDDLGSQVPKSTDLTLALKTISDQLEDDKKRVKNAIAGCRVHS
jgi:hypothetical protein